MVRLISSTIVALFALLFLPVAGAQGLQTGTLRGVVKDATGAVVPNVSIHATSAALQGELERMTDESGAYQFAGLPPGSYKIQFQAAGFMTVVAEGRVGLGSIERLDVTVQIVPIEAAPVTVI